MRSTRRLPLDVTEVAAVRLGPSAAATRRVLGPLAWSALEVLATRPPQLGDRSVVAMSVRALAVELGVATNTAQRALRALREAGLVEHAQGRADGGRFIASGYRLAIPNDVLCVEEAGHASIEQPLRSARKRPTASKPVPSLGQQLVLLPS